MTFFTVVASSNSRENLLRLPAIKQKTVHFDLVEVLNLMRVSCEVGGLSNIC